MLQAQRWDATDADAHVVLGVLYNVSRDYDSAAEAFRRAIEARPNDHSLWNKVMIIFICFCVFLKSFVFCHTCFLERTGSWGEGAGCRECSIFRMACKDSAVFCCDDAEGVCRRTAVSDGDGS